MTVSSLAQAIQHANLPHIIERFYPGSNLGHNRARALWRGGDGNSVSYWQGSDSKWHITDFVTGETHDAYAFLTRVAGLSQGDAAQLLIHDAGLPSHRYRHKIKPVKATSPASRNEDSRAADDIKQWRACATTGTSPYLEHKDIADVVCSFLRYSNSHISLLIQAISPDGLLEPRGVQRIFHNLSKHKLYSKGLNKHGSFVAIGIDKLKDIKKRVIVCEGFATGASLHKATGTPVLCALDSGNLAHVVQSLRRHRGSRSKLKIVIAADNDQWKGSSNPGLEAAHSVALSYGCLVASPSFTGLDTSSKPTDFNDLQQLTGIDSVATQVSTTSRASTAYAYAKAHRRQHKMLERKGASYGPTLPALDLRKGVTLLQAPQGTGKTTALEPLIHNCYLDNKRVLYVTHRTSLAADAARRLGLDLYDDLDGSYIRDANSLAVCVNSLHRLLGTSGTLTPFDVVIIDESEQFANALSGNHIANKHSNLQALEFFVRKAQHIIMADADLGELSHELAARLRPHEHYHEVLHHHDIGSGRVLKLHDDKDGVYGALSSMDAPVVVTTNSKHQATCVHEFLREQGKRGLLITSDTSAEHSQFLADIDSNAQDMQLDYLVASPSISTGVSLTSGYFQHVVGIFNRAIGTPEDALQSIWRVRTMATYNLWVDPVRSFDQVDLDARYGPTLQREQHSSGKQGIRCDWYDEIRLLAERKEQQARHNYLHDFLKLATLQGFSCEWVETAEGHKGLAKQAKELAEACYVDSISTARNLDDKQAAQLSSSRNLSQTDRYALTRHHIKDFYVLGGDDDEVIKQWAARDRRGRYRRELTLLETSLSPTESVNRLVSELTKDIDMAVDRPLIYTRRDFYQKVLEAVNFKTSARTVLNNSNSQQVELARYSKQSLELFRQWLEQNRNWIAGIIALPSAGKLRANIVRYVGTWLNQLGLKQRRTGNTHDATYALDLESLTLACSTIKRRNTLSLECLVSEKSVLTTDPGGGSPPPRWLQRLETIVTEGVFNHIPSLDLLKSYILQALNGCQLSLEALRSYCQQPEVETLLNS